MKKIIIRILLIVCVGVFAFSGWKLYSTMREYALGEEIYEDVLERSVTEQPDDARTPITVDFDQLRKECPNIVGWIYCADTLINYPVVQGEDNSYYLKHAYDGTSSSNGAIFVNCYNSPGFTDTNTIIYGHNMKNNTMFAGLSEFADQAYYQAHPIIWLLTPEQDYKILLFSGYTTDNYSDAYTVFDEAGADYAAFLSSRVAQSDFKASVTPASTQRIVTLSTCTYSFKNARYVIHGVLEPIE